MLSQSEGQIQLVNFPTREENILDLILISLPGHFQMIYSPDKLTDHDLVAGTLKRRKKPWRKIYLSQTGDFNSMRRDSSNFLKEKYCNCHSGSHSVQENFNLMTSFILDIPSERSRSVSSVPWNLEGRFEKGIKFMQKQKRLAVVNADLSFRN